MKKIAVILIITLFVFILGSCNSKRDIQEEKYTMNASYAYGSDDLISNILSYEFIITGKEDDIENIDTFEVLTNMEYSDLVIDNDTHSIQKELGEKPYYIIKGNVILDTSGKSKEELDKMKILESIKIIDMDKDEVFIDLNQS